REAAARARLQALLDSVPSGIVFLEREGSVPVLNRFLEPFVHLGLDREDHPLRRAQRTREGVEERASLERADGRFVTMLVTAVPVATARGEDAGAIATFHDI